MTPDSLKHHQVSSNEAVTSLLARCPVDRPENANICSRIRDQWGEGVPTILSRREALSGRRPDYQIVGESELSLTLHAPRMP